MKKLPSSLTEGEYLLIRRRTAVRSLATGRGRLIDLHDKGAGPQQYVTPTGVGEGWRRCPAAGAASANEQLPGGDLRGRAGRWQSSQRGGPAPLPDLRTSGWPALCR